MPERIQRRRTPGWRMPPNTRYIGRGTIYGNPFIVQADPSYQLPWVVFWSEAGAIHSMHRTKRAAHQAAVDNFRDWITQDTLDPKLWTPQLIVAHVKLKARLAAGELAGQDLCCWCRPEDECHGDVLLELSGGVS